jgi:hypothetical protein
MNIKTDLFHSDIHYIYLTTNLVNNKKYIGQRKLPVNCKVENDKYLGSGTLLLKAVGKYGREKFKKEILEICYSQQEADRLENLYFEKYDVLNKKDVFYNRGLAGQKWRPDYHKSFMSDRMKEYYKDEKNLKNWFEKSVKKSKKWQNKTFEEFLVNRKDKEKRKRILNIVGKEKGEKIFFALSQIKRNQFSIEDARLYINGKYINKSKKLKGRKPKQWFIDNAKKQWNNPDTKKKMIEANDKRKNKNIIIINGAKHRKCKKCNEIKSIDKFKTFKQYNKIYHDCECRDCYNLSRVNKDEQKRLNIYNSLELKCDICGNKIEYESWKGCRYIKRCNYCRENNKNLIKKKNKIPKIKKIIYKICQGCGKEKPLTDFKYYKFKSRRENICNECVDNGIKPIIIKNNTIKKSIDKKIKIKNCIHCHKDKPLNNFYYNNRLNRYHSICRECNDQ